ncbi:LysR family transcriptional regulator [uncultured Shewanella sp.]|uniref:LysR family transcriptional regulator n=1 Tax=uncultured Shewanella sp. TaxID=173975 RepID=UPI00260B0B3D|nr:LysR family transcriptional regulator [uncultured Shewanella sp.]
MDVLKSMHIFKQVAESQSFTSAADKLNIVPSAVSRQINELESWLGRRLIHRTTRSLHLTEDGKEYLARMATILHQVNDLKATPETNGPLSGRIKMTTPVIVGQQDIAKIVAQFKVNNPKVDITFTLENRSVNIVEEGYDLAIRTGMLSNSNFYARKVSDISFKTVASPHYLKNNPVINTPIELHSHLCLINTARPNPRRWTFNIKGLKKTVKVNGTLETNNAFCILDFAKSGVGIAQLPDQYVKDSLKKGELIEILSDFALEPIPINVIYPSNRLLSHSTRALIDSIVQYYSTK